MLRNYLTIAWRNLLRHKVFSLINILGLAIGMAACLLILQYVQFERSYDAVHNRDRIFRVGTNFYREGVPTGYASTFPPMGPSLKADFPEVEEFTRLSFRGGTITYQRTKFREPNVYFADAAFLPLFSIPLKKGSASQALTAPNAVVLSESAARKYFGEEEAMGKILILKNKFLEKSLTVTGIFRDLPPNSHLSIDFLVSFETMLQHPGLGEATQWANVDHYTYILLKPGTDLKKLQEKFPVFLDKYLGKVWGEKGIGLGKNRTEILLHPLGDIHLHSKLRNEAETNGDARTVHFLTILALFTLVVACVNYVNLSTARSLERAREVGLRKVIGTSRLQLMKQFFLESVLFNLVALVFSLTLVQLTSPLFRSLTGKPLPSIFSGNIPVWAFFPGLFLLSSFLSGAYPALVLSSFKPLEALKGRLQNLPVTTSLRKGLVVFQFAVSVLLLAGTFAVYRQLRFMSDHDLGMNIQQTLVVNAPELIGADSVYAEKISVFKTEMQALPPVRKVSVSSAVPGAPMYGSIGAVGRVGTKPEELGYMFHHLFIDGDFLNLYQLKILAGRQFSSKLASDSKVVILNEAALKVLGFRSPATAVGHKILYESEKEIVGVVKDFNHYSLEKAVVPIILEFHQTDPKFFSLKIGTSHLKETLASVQNTYAGLFPNSPFEYYFLDEAFDQQYKADERFGQLFGLFSALAIFIACLGLFGLASFATIRRTKEIGVRKVLGATIPTILLLLSKDFIKLVLVANIVAWPLAYWGVYKWLENYAFRIEITPWLFILPALLVMLIALLTVSFQTWKAARQNPVKALRYE